MGKRSFCLAVIFLVSIIFMFTGCRSEVVKAEKTLRIGGAWDLISPFERKIIPSVEQEIAAGIEIKYSPNAIDEMRAGKFDVVLLGREPSSKELEGLIDNVIALDAVCIIIDANSFEGGEYWEDQIIFSGGTSSEALTPVRKAEGFRNLSLDDLKGIFCYNLRTIATRWSWSGEYYSWKAAYDLDTASYSSEKQWTPDYNIVNPCLKLTPGKYDFQTLLYQKLGLDEAAIARTWNNQFSDSKYHAEEEILAATYRTGKPFDAGSSDFTYFLGFCSRRVIPVAMQHIPIRVVSVNGIDPLNDSQSVYADNYAFNRKIHVLSRENSSSNISDFINCMVSSRGQQLLEKAGYLPLRTGQE